MLKIESLSVSVRGKQLLRDLNLELFPGEITVLLGPNGSGKTTLLRALTGSLPYSGSVLLKGRNFSTVPATDRGKLIGLMPQKLPDSPLTVRELVSLGRNPYLGPSGRMNSADREKVEEVLSLLKLEPLSTRRTDTLSGGERQRAFLALLLTQNPPVLLLDEPSASLDAPSSRELFALLTSLAREQGKTLLVTLHDLGEAFSLADRIAVLQSGELSFSGSPEECLRREIPEKLFGVRRWETEGGLFFR